MSQRRTVAALIGIGLLVVAIIATRLVLTTPLPVPRLTSIPFGNVSPTPASPTPEATSSPPPSLVLEDPRLRFGLVTATFVDGTLSASAELDGWIAGRTVRWYALSGTGLAGHLREEALIAGKLLIHLDSGAWEPAPGGGGLDPWTLLDIATGTGALDLAASPLRCTFGQMALKSDALAHAFGPDSPPTGASGAIEVKPMASGCELSFYARWSGGAKTETDWSRTLDIWPDAAVPPADAVIAAGYPNPGEASDTPAADLSGASSAPVAIASPGIATPSAAPTLGESFTAYGSLHYQVTFGPISAPQPAFDVAPASVTFDSTSGTLRMSLQLQIGAKDNGFLGVIQKDFTYGLVLKALVVDGAPVESVPAVNAKDCQLTAQTSGPQSLACDITVPLAALPNDSVRMYLEMTGALDPPKVGYTAFWVTLIGVGKP